MDVEGKTYEPGAVCLWRWSSLRRFFPLGQEKAWYEQADLVGVAAVRILNVLYVLVMSRDLYTRLARTS